LPVYTYDTLNVDEHVSRFINQRFACVFTGTCRLAKSVCDSVVTTWQRRDPGVKDALEKCADLARRMLIEYRRLGQYGERDLESGSAGDEEIRRLGTLLEEHKLAQQSLWPSIESPTVKAIYDALSPISYGNFICGAGSGGHVIAFLKPDIGIEDVERVVKACEDAPEARVVQAQLIL
jgi:fucokinase